ncbi:SLATT domain-containing protein [Xenorhabdus sp. 42]|uniref:SLATT domain-containing protein n=1 Tax=Xenorhabdus szentirmaii TaxID=290112 RepID=UPI0019BE2F28|nr:MULTISPECIES: SLATT domain-containing protein [unclassified Xenorhabdus]MBD2791367.1 SLATT domain-containing protein [Xenorhabdus sp. CUL]MBD2821759.1 SLATT domain-containing protein [Xenorhabdus sp. 42]MBD2823402.1 SLATT domain-containing protein [Xenorhabdus sp. 5]
MNKSDLLKSIAEKGYDIGFGAKKHFATYDIIEKTPGFISFISMAVGIYALCIDGLSDKLISATFIVLGIVGLYVNLNGHKKDDYEKAGSELTKCFNQLKALYIEVNGSEDEQKIPDYQIRLTEIENNFYSASISKQIMFSNWYAHYKFFWEHQIDWIDEQLHFRFFRDKLPLSFSIAIVVVFIGFFCVISDSKELICGVSNPSPEVAPVAKEAPRVSEIEER